jgi:hypothetical protein
MTHVSAMASTIAASSALAPIAHAEDASGQATGYRLQATGPDKSAAAPATVPAPAPTPATAPAPPSSPPPTTAAPPIPAPAPAQVPYPYAPYPYYPYAPYPYYPSYPPPPAEQLLTLQAKSGARLEVHQANDWRSVCAAPCTTRALVGAEYRVNGERIVTSRPFVVSPSPYPTLVKAEVGSTSARVAGATLIALGALAAAGGTVVAMSSGDSDADDRAALIGSLTALVGGGVLTAGIFLVTSSNTRLDFLHAGTAVAPRFRVGRGLELTAQGLAF